MEHTYETFTRSKVWNKRAKPAVLRVDADGRITFSAEAANVLGLKDGDLISFVIDNADHAIVYFHKDKDGLPLMNIYGGKTGNRLAVYCRPMGRKILEHMGMTSYRTFLISPETTLLPTGYKAWFILKHKTHGTKGNKRG